MVLLISIGENESRVENVYAEHIGPTARPGPCLNIKTIFSGIGNFNDKTVVIIFIMGTPILTRRHLYIETVNWT